MNINLSSIIDVFKDVVQIIFWIVASSIAILTYRRAKKTLLQPLRTEIFKQQLEVLSGALKKFAAKGEADLRRDFGIDDLEWVNIHLLMDDFIEHFYDQRRPEEVRPYGKGRCPTAMISERHLLANSVLVDAPVRSQPSPREPIEPSVRGAIWLRREHEVIPVPESFREAKDELRRLIDSPLLPNQITHLLSEFDALLDESVSEIQGVLTLCSKELPEKYPNRTVLADADLTWIHNRINGQLPKLNMKAQEVTGRIRAYFEIEDIMMG